MPYKLSILPSWDEGGSILELAYDGPVPYAERVGALADMSEMLSTTTIRRILVDFSKACLQLGSDGERLDFVSRSIVTPGFDECRVAMLGLEADHARTFMTTAHIRKMEARMFEHRDDAMAWLQTG